MTLFSLGLEAPTPHRRGVLTGLLVGLLFTVGNLAPASGQGTESALPVESSGSAPPVQVAVNDSTAPVPAGEVASASSYAELASGFASPDHGRWGEVPLWWWEAAPMTEERVTWQLETLKEQGVEAVCPIQRSPARSQPSSFIPAWWDMFDHAHAQADSLGMRMWAYDQVGYGHYGWLEMAAARVGDQASDTNTRKMDVHIVEGRAGEPIRLDLPTDGEVLGARAYPLKNDTLASDDGSRDVRSAVSGDVLEWTPEEGRWRVAVTVATPFRSFYLNPAATDAFLSMLYGRLEEAVGEEAMGGSFAGVFQDEHPPTPRDIYTDRLANTFQEQHGYPIERALPALHFDVGASTPKYRSDFFDTYIGLVEDTYWEKVYDWTHDRGILTSYDNWGRKDIYRQSQGYMDYFRTQRWYTAPGYDDSGQHPLTGRNYYDTKIAASIARLYQRPRVWSEAFHSSGWGRTTNQTITWLTTNYAFGANLYDEHGLYYSINAGTWEHAAPDPHWNQPYWRYYGTLSDWVTRLSYVMSQGQNVTDVAVHYPAVSLLAGHGPGTDAPDYNRYMELSRTIYDEGIDNDIIDDGSILDGTIENGRLRAGGTEYRALVFGPEVTMRRAVVRKALAFAESGGTVLFYGRLPTASVEGGRGDSELQALLNRLLGVTASGDTTPTCASNRFSEGGFAAFVPRVAARLPALITSTIDRDFLSGGEDVYVTHRRIGEAEAYLLQNTEPEAITLPARFRADGQPEQWNLFDGTISPLANAETEGGYTRVPLRMEGNAARLIVFRPEDASADDAETRPLRPWQQVDVRAESRQELPDEWTFSTIPTRDNQWGAFRWPPSEQMIGPEVREVRYREPEGTPGTELGWHRPGYDDSGWTTHLYSSGPQWLALTGVPANADLSTILDGTSAIRAGQGASVGDAQRTWHPVTFSKTIGTGEAAPWGGHSGYPDGHIDREFIEVPGDGRKFFFTRVRSPEAQRLGLRVELRNSDMRLWVNGEEQPFEGSVGNLPLAEGSNSVLLAIPDGGTGRLYVQQTPPSVRTLDEAAEAEGGADLREASWIWAGDADGAYFRKTLSLGAVPQNAQLVITGYTGYRLFINGTRVEEEIGPWSDWQQPETINVRPYLQEGENVIAVWGQFYRGQHFNTDASTENRAFTMALRARMPDGTPRQVVSDGSWVGSSDVVEGWEQPGFNDSGWQAVRVKGQVGDEPWGNAFLENIGTATTPDRPLSVNLESPYLQVFEGGPDITYDIKPETAPRVGWARFEVPPGTQELSLPTDASVRAWVNGREVPVENSTVRVPSPAEDVATVALRMEMAPGAYGGAAFSTPLDITMGGGTMPLGDWTEQGLPTYSGIGVYEQSIRLTEEEAREHPVLDLGEVRVAAEVFVNGESVGARIAAPFKYDLEGMVEPGENTITVHVANTLAPHYEVPPKTLHQGPTKSGLIGPVSLFFYDEEALTTSQ